MFRHKRQLNFVPPSLTSLLLSFLRISVTVFCVAGGGALWRPCPETIKIWSPSALQCGPIGLSRHHGPLSALFGLLCIYACICFRRFSSSVTSRPLYDDHDEHSMAKRVFPLQLRLCGARNACNRFVGAKNACSQFVGAHSRAFSVTFDTARV